MIRSGKDIRAKKWIFVLILAISVALIVVVKAPDRAMAAESPLPEPPSNHNDPSSGSIAGQKDEDRQLHSPNENPTAQVGVWITTEEVRQLPMSGPAWVQLKEMADEPVGPPDLSIQVLPLAEYKAFLPMIAAFPLYAVATDDSTNIIILAKALVFARTGKESYRDEVEQALGVITYQNTEDGGRTLALGRSLASYVIAADLIVLAEHNPALDSAFRIKLRELLDKELDGRTLRSTHEERPNNWGTHAGASRAAVAVYLGDEAELARTAQVFKGFLGDRSSYAGFKFGDDDSWQCDPDHPVPINPKDCMKEGHLIDGAMPDEMRRGGRFRWPPIPTGYPWEGLQGAIVQAHILHRAGYDTWNWENQAIRRAVEFLYRIGWPAEGDDAWQLWLINSVYGTSFPTELPARTGKNMGFTDWTHAN